MPDVSNFEYLEHPSFNKNRLNYADRTKARMFIDDANQADPAQRPVALNLDEMIEVIGGGGALLFITAVTAGTERPVSPVPADVGEAKWPVGSNIYRELDNGIIQFFRATGETTSALYLELFPGTSRPLKSFPDPGAPNGWKDFDRFAYDNDGTTESWEWREISGELVLLQRPLGGGGGGGSVVYTDDTLQGDGTQGNPLSVPGAAQYIHQQTTPALVWVVNHNLGSVDSVNVYIGGIKVHANIEQTGANSLNITFQTPQTGTATIER